jgi:hypothetical protein
MEITYVQNIQEAIKLLEIELEKDQIEDIELLELIGCYD